MSGSGHQYINPMEMNHCFHGSYILLGKYTVKIRIQFLICWAMIKIKGKN